MVLTIVLLSIVSIVSSVSLIVSVKLNNKAGATIIAYEKFFEETIEDLAASIAQLDRLLKRDTIGNDPEIKAVRRVLAHAHDTLVGYVDAAKEKSRADQQAQKAD
jgi:hypothetical protein